MPLGTHESAGLTVTFGHSAAHVGWDARAEWSGCLAKVAPSLRLKSGSSMGLQVILEAVFLTPT